MDEVWASLFGTGWSKLDEMSGQMTTVAHSLNSLNVRLFVPNGMPSVFVKDGFQLKIISSGASQLQQGSKEPKIQLLGPASSANSAFRLISGPSATTETSLQGSALRLKGGQVFGVKLLSKRDSLPLTPDELSVASNQLDMCKTMCHPHLVSYFDTFVHDCSMVLVMNQVQNGTLASLMDKNLSALAIVEIASQVASALSYLHGIPAVHGAVRPVNVTLTGGSPLRVVLSLPSEPMSASGHFLELDGATPCAKLYTAPEERNEANCTLQFSADIWSLGMMMMELLRGSRVSGGAEIIWGDNVLNDLRMTTVSALGTSEGAYRDIMALADKILQMLSADRPTADQVLRDANALCKGLLARKKKFDGPWGQEVKTPDTWDLVEANESTELPMTISLL